MAVDWDSFKNNVKQYFEAFIANDSDAAASFIALQYDIAMYAGKDILFGNPVATKNKDILEQMIKASFQLGMLKKAGTYNSLELISKGLSGYWAGATLIPGTPPPGSLAIVQNLVISPGSAKGLETFNVKNYDSWLDAFIIMARSQLLSMSGITIALVLTPAGPVPTPFPWQGYN